MDQRQKALRNANAIRLGRVRVRREIREGKRSVLEALADPACATATISSMLEAQFRWGRAKTSALLARVAWEAPISHQRQIRDLTSRQVEALRKAL